MLIEKPFTKNLSEAKKLEKIAKKKGIVLQIGHIERFNKAYIKLEKLVKNPLFIECNRKPNYHLFKRYQTCVETLIPTLLEPLLKNKPFPAHPLWIHF